MNARSIASLLGLMLAWPSPSRAATTEPPLSPPVPEPIDPSRTTPDTPEESNTPPEVRPPPEPAPPPATPSPEGAAPPPSENPNPPTPPGLPSNPTTAETPGPAVDASTEEPEPRINPDAVPELRGADRPSQRRTIGLEPSAPQATALPGGVTPAFGQKSRNSSDWIFDIHGFLQLPLRVGLNEREDPGPGQKRTVLHTPPVTPGDFPTFEYTSVVPDPWAQLNLSYGNDSVTASIIIAARTVSNANAYFDPADQLGINDAFITFHPRPGKIATWNIHVGAFANRYGIMGEYDMGRYGTPLLARVGGVGATGTGKFDLDGVSMAAELGVVGQLNKSPVGVEPAGWNGFSDPNAGTSFAAHGHGSVGFGRTLTLGVNAIYAFARDDRATSVTQKDGNIGVYGGDLRLTLRRFGHLYLGYGHTRARTSRSVSGVIRVLNAPGGYGLMEEYFGLQSEGTGQLHTFGAQYDFSLGNVLRYPKPFNGNGPDLVFTAFGIGTRVSSPVPERDGAFKLKYGGGLTYAFLKYMALGLRGDGVHPDLRDATRNHGIISPQLIFKSGWGSRDQVVIQYSGFFYGENSVARTGYPPQRDPTVALDRHVISLIGSVWW